MMTCLPWSILDIMYLLVSMWQLCSFHNCNTTGTNTIFWHVSLLHELQLMIFVDDAGGEWPMIGHAPWNGCNLADFVMPFFLFIVGMSIALAFKVGLATLFEHVTTSFRELILLLQCTYPKVFRHAANTKPHDSHKKGDPSNSQTPILGPLVTRWALVVHTLNIYLIVASTN